MRRAGRLRRPYVESIASSRMDTVSRSDFSRKDLTGIIVEHFAVKCTNLSVADLAFIPLGKRVDSLPCQRLSYLNHETEDRQMQGLHNMPIRRFGACWRKLHLHLHLRPSATERRFCEIRTLMANWLSSPSHTTQFFKVSTLQLMLLDRHTPQDFIQWSRMWVSRSIA